MKKLKLTLDGLNQIDALTRKQLKKVMGGYEGGNGSPKTDACKDSKEGDICIWKYSGNTYSGKCRSYMGQPLHCSDLN